MESILEIFNASQLSKQLHKSNTKKLISLLTTHENKVENVSFFLHACIDKVLLCQKQNSYVINITEFICSLLASLDDENLHAFVKHICSRISSSNKAVRQRICIIITMTLELMMEKQIELSCDVIAELTGSLLPRINDKIPTVRLAAVMTLRLLQDVTDPADKCTEEIVRVMLSDSSVSVRLAAVKAMTIFEANSVHLCSRLRDVSSEIRIAAIARLADDLDMRSFKVRIRAEIVKLCLTDRDELVRVAGKKLVMAWLNKLTANNGCKHKDALPKLLQLLNPVNAEEEAVLLGTTVLEELTKNDVKQDYSAEMKDAVRAKGVDWNKGLAAITPSDILWVYLRGNFSRQYLPVLVASEICSAVFPSGEEIALLLREAKNACDLSTNAKKQFVVKYLLRLCVLVACSTESTQSRSLLLAECGDLLADVTLGVDMVEPVLKTFAAMRDYNSNKHSISSSETLMAMVNMMKMQTVSAVDPGDSNGDIQCTARCLQIMYWALQQEVGAMGTASPTDALAVHFSELIPFVMSSLQRPVASLRSLSLGCLGLMSLLSVDVCREHKHIILQVASGGFEEDIVREQAAKCLGDLACVHKSMFQDDADLCNILLRLQDCDDSELVYTASESAAKLLFAGVLSDSSLFANLVKFFFLSDLLPPSDQDDDFADLTARGGFSASSRLQQILSIFFQAFMVCEGRCEQVVLESIAQLVGDITSSVKFRDAKVTSLNTVVRHLLALCGNVQLVSDSEAAMSSATLKSMIMERAVSALCRELLKLGNSKVDKMISKEYVKLLGSWCVSEWMSDQKVYSVRAALQAVSSCVSLDKASMKVLAVLMAECSAKCTDTQHSPEGYVFLTLAPGLADLVALASKTNFADDDCESDHVSVLLKNKNKPVKRSSKEVYEESSSASEDDQHLSEEENEDDQHLSEEENEVVGRRKGLVRSSKIVAAKKIASQLVE